ncbi:MAG: transcriptional repressor [Planctomycetes bacterium]|nr:transcriptional repressor [Planctomycetota bacterium]
MNGKDGGEREMTRAQAPAAFEKFLRGRGLKLTRPRWVILEAALDRRDHFSADELADRLRKNPRPVSKASVYRTLALLKESGLLEEHDFGGGRKFYEQALGRTHHDHLVCIGCGQITEFQNPRIEHMQDQVTEREGFVSVFHSLKIFGYCRACRKRGVSADPQTAHLPREIVGIHGSTT